MGVQRLVLVLRDRLEMGGVGARPVQTLVVKLKSCRQRPDEGDPGSSVCQPARAERVQLAVPLGLQPLRWPADVRRSDVNVAPHGLLQIHPSGLDRCIKRLAKNVSSMVCRTEAGGVPGSFTPFDDTTLAASCVQPADLDVVSRVTKTTPTGVVRPAPPACPSRLPTALYRTRHTAIVQER